MNLAEAAAADEESFILEKSVRGHHVDKVIWRPVIGEILQVQAEANNEQDAHAVATVLHGVVVGHLPHEISGVAWYFLQHGGHITCEITGPRKLSNVENKGLVVPYWGKPAMIKRLMKVMVNKGKKATTSHC